MRRWGLLAFAATVGVASIVVPSIAESAPGTTDSYGLVDPASGVWRLYSGGQQITQFFYGNPGDYPFMGDWDCDSVDTPGLYRQSDGYVYLSNSNAQGNADVSFFFGNPGDIPVAGDFNADGCDTVSIYRPSNQTFYIINELGTADGGLGAADYYFVFGNPGDKPFVGDFNGNGQDTIGLHRESSGLVYYRNTNTQGNADNQFIFGDPGDRLITGDWTGNGVDSPGLFRPSGTTMYLRYENSQGNADEAWVVGQSAWLPVAGYFPIPTTPPSTTTTSSTTTTLPKTYVVSQALIPPNEPPPPCGDGFCIVESMTSNSKDPGGLKASCDSGDLATEGWIETRTRVTQQGTTVVTTSRSTAVAPDDLIGNPPLPGSYSNTTTVSAIQLWEWFNIFSVDRYTVETTTEHTIYVICDRR